MNSNNPAARAADAGASTSTDRRLLLLPVLIGFAIPIGTAVHSVIPVLVTALLVSVAAIFLRSKQQKGSLGVRIAWLCCGAFLIAIGLAVYAHK